LNEDIETPIPMSFSHSFLRRIPQSSVRLFVVLAVFAAVAVMSFAIVAGSSHDSVVRHVPADSRSKS
jgi:hypothetical protein